MLLQSFSNRPAQNPAHPQQPQPQQPWMAAMNGGGPMANGTPQQMPNMTPQNQNQESHAPSSPFHPSLVQSQQQQPIPRSGPTPQQQQMAHLMGRPSHGSPHPSPSMQPRPPSRPPSLQPGIPSQQALQRAPDATQNGLPFPPIMDAALFRRLLQQFLSSNNIPIEQAMLVVGEAHIDLHKLHVEVIRRGGWKAVCTFLCSSSRQN